MTGTWVELRCGTIWVFNSDGTGKKDGKQDFKYAAISNKVVIYYGTDYYGHPYDYISNGNTVMLLPIGGSTAGHVLTKRN
jgi:hypothetical protein